MAQVDAVSVLELRKQGLKKDGTLAAGIIFSLSIAFYDLILTAVFRSHRLSFFPVMLPPLCALVVTAFLIFLLFRTISRFIVAPALQSRRLSLCIAFLCFAGTLFALASVWFHADPTVNSSTRAVSALMYFSIATAVAFVTYLSFDILAGNRWIAAVAFVLPFLLAEVWLFAWFHVYRIGRFLSPASMILNVVFLAIFLATVAFSFKASERLKQKLLVFLMAVVVAAPLLLAAYRHVKSGRNFQAASHHKVSRVILITIDTLRADELSSFGSTRIKTPNIDAIAGDSVVFTNAYSSAPWTLPSLVSIMTGHSPLTHHVLKGDGVIPDKIPTFAEYMRSAGYKTISVANNPYIVRANLSRGFQEFDFYPQKFTSSIGSSLLGALFPASFREQIDTFQMTSLARKALSQNRSMDLFAWIHYLDPHAPYAPARKYLDSSIAPKIGKSFDGIEQIRGGRFSPNAVERESIRKLYEGEIREVDDNIGLLMTRMKDIGIYDETLIVLTADHGEEFWDHGGIEHGHSLYNELLNVPLLMKLPRSYQRGPISDPVSTESVLPTVLELCGINARDDYLKAHSLLPYIHKASREPQVLVSTATLYFDPLVSVIFDHFKYIKDQATNRERLYDIAEDSDELQSLSLPQEIQTARRLLEERYRWAEALRKSYGVSDKSQRMDEDTREQLRSLGYVQ